jgi:hypothetical protein
MIDDGGPTLSRLLIWSVQLATLVVMKPPVGRARESIPA